VQGAIENLIVLVLVLVLVLVVVLDAKKQE
jgi:hypothetical protein